MIRTVSFILMLLISTFAVSAAVVSFDHEGSGNLVGPRATFTVTFDEAPEPGRLVLSMSSRGSVDHSGPTRCSDTSCTFDSVRTPAGSFEAYVTYRNAEAGSLDLVGDHEGPVVEELSISTGTPGSLAFEAEDPAGVSYRVSRSGVTVGTGSGSEATIPVDSLIAGAEERLVIVLEDGFGNERVVRLEGPVESEPVRITSISGDAMLDGSGNALVSFSLEGPVDAGSVSVHVDGMRYGAVCSGRGALSCVSRIPADGSASVLVRASSPFGLVSSRTASVSFVEDTVAPRFTRITTEFSGYSDASTSYADESFIVEFEENGIIDPADVIVEVNGVRTTAQSCARNGDDVLCTVPYTSGSVEFINTWDVAGNEVEVPDGALTEQDLARDTTQPQVERVALASGGQVSQAATFTLSATGDVTVLVTVEAEGSRLGRLEIEAEDESEDWTETLGFECSSITSGSAQCESEPVTIEEDTRLSLALYDASGIPHRTERLVKVGGSIDPGVYSWDVSEIRASPGYYIEGSSLPTTVSIEVASPSVTSAMSLAGASILDCDGIDVPFASSLDETITITGYANNDGTATCTLELATMRYGRIESETQELEVEIEFEDITTAGLQSPIDRYNENPAARQIGSTLETADTYIGYAEAVCTGYDGLNLASLATNAAATAAGGNTNPIGLALSAVGATLFQSVEGLGGIADQLCPIIQCKIPIGEANLGLNQGAPGVNVDPDAVSAPTLQDEVLGFYNAIEGPTRTGINEALGFGLVPEEQSVSRVHDSLVLSTITMCLPGVISNVNDVMQVECGRQLCLLKVHAGDYAGSAAMCDYAANIQQCTFVSDEVFAVVPFGAFVQDIGGVLESVASRPLQVAIDWGLSAAASADPTIRTLMSGDLATVLAWVQAGVTGEDPAEEIPGYCTELNEYVDELRDEGYDI